MALGLQVGKKSTKKRAEKKRNRFTNLTAEAVVDRLPLPYYLSPICCRGKMEFNHFMVGLLFFTNIVCTSHCAHLELNILLYLSINPRRAVGCPGREAGVFSGDKLRSLIDMELVYNNEVILQIPSPQKHHGNEAPSCQFICARLREKGPTPL